MKESPIFPGFDTDYYDAGINYEFDPQADFSQFLEEARRYSNGGCEKLPGKNGDEKRPGVEKESTKKKKKKSSWKTSLFSFWRKTEKKGKQCLEKAPPLPPSLSRGYMSGPIQMNGGARMDHRRPASGPLSSLFYQKNKEKNVKLIPYVNLDMLNSNNKHCCSGKAKPYGPVYLVS